MPKPVKLGAKGAVAMTRFPVHCCSPVQRQILIAKTVLLYISSVLHGFLPNLPISSHIIPYPYPRSPTCSPALQRLARTLVASWINPALAKVLKQDVTYLASRKCSSSRTSSKSSTALKINSHPMVHKASVFKNCFAITVVQFWRTN